MSTLENSSAHPEGSRYPPVGECPYGMIILPTHATSRLADRKLIEFLIIGRNTFDTQYTGHFRPLTEPPLKFIQLPGFSTGKYLNTSITKVPDPSCNTLPDCLLPGLHTEEYTLNASADKTMY